MRRWWAVAPAGAGRRARRGDVDLRQSQSFLGLRLRAAQRQQCRTDQHQRSNDAICHDRFLNVLICNGIARARRCDEARRQRSGQREVRGSGRRRGENRCRRFSEERDFGRSPGAAGGARPARSRSARRSAAPGSRRSRNSRCRPGRRRSCARERYCRRGRGGEGRLDRMQPMDMAERQPKLEGQRQQRHPSPRAACWNGANASKPQPLP